MPVYDVHAHIVPTELMDYLRVDGPEVGLELFTTTDGNEKLRVAGRQELGPFPTELFDLDARFAAMDSGGVDVQLVGHRTEFSAYALPGEQGARYARAFNQILADLVSRHPSRLMGLGTVPLQDPKRAAAELAYLVQDLGMIGVEIATHVDGTPIDRAGLDPFWEAANELRCLVLFHPNDPLPGLDLDRYFMGNIVGRPAESTVAIGYLLLSGVFERYPDLVLCMVHGGGYMPYQIGRWQKGYKVVPHLVGANIAQAPLEYVKRLYFDSLVHIPEALSFLLELVGPSQVVVGTDYPYEMAERAPVTFIDSIPGLGDEDREAILGGNVQRIIDGIRR
ncbi:MAG TPA: amidohydrolase family protein [Acidimicrobiia bacterium]|nr:amidohydrolase family protein [Acidimicrobiia bacterium]